MWHLLINLLIQNQCQSPAGPRPRALARGEHICAGRGACGCVRVGSRLPNILLEERKPGLGRVNTAASHGNPAATSSPSREGGRAGPGPCRTRVVAWTWVCPAELGSGVGGQAGLRWGRRRGPGRQVCLGSPGARERSLASPPACPPRVAWGSRHRNEVVAVPSPLWPHLPPKKSHLEYNKHRGPGSDNSLLL